MSLQLWYSATSWQNNSCSLHINTRSTIHCAMVGGISIPSDAHPSADPHLIWFQALSGAAEIMQTFCYVN